MLTHPLAHKRKDTHLHTDTRMENIVAHFSTQCIVSLYHPIQTALTLRNASINREELKWTDTVHLQI